MCKHFELDTLAMEVRLPEEKLQETQTMVSSWLGKKSCQRKDLESLVGKLAHASKVVQPRKTFMRRMFELLKGTRMAHHHVRLKCSIQGGSARFLEEWKADAAEWIAKRAGGKRPMHYLDDFLVLDLL